MSIGKYAIWMEWYAFISNTAPSIVSVQDYNIGNTTSYVIQ
jgi:hypothetical protein